MFTDIIITSTVYALLHSLWQALLISMALVVFTKTAKKTTSGLRYSFSFISLFALFASSIITFYHYFFKLSLKLEQVSYNLHGTSPIQAANSTGTTGALQSFFDNYSSFIFVLWFSGVTVFFLKFCIDLYYTNSIGRKRYLELPDEIVGSFIKIACGMGVNKVIRFIESPLVNVPAVVGFFKPVVILPLGLISKIPADQLEAVICHEIAHIARNDFLHNLIQSLVEIVYFFNPSVIIISRIIRAERENCCDDLAVTQCRDSALLAKGLYNLELIHSNLPKPVMAAAGKKNNLLCRIKRLIGKENDMTKTYSGFIASLAVLTVITVITGCTLFASGNKEDERIQKEKQIKVVVTSGDVDDEIKLYNFDGLQWTGDSGQVQFEEIKKQLESALKELEQLKGDQKIKIEEKLKAALEKLKEHTDKLNSDLKKIRIFSGGDDDVMIFTGGDSSKADIKECKEIKIIVKDGDDDEKEVKMIKRIDKGESTIQLDELWKNLIADGIFKEKSDNLKIEIEDDEIEINGVEIPDRLLEKYKKLLL